MNIKTTMFITVMALSVLAACGEKKVKDTHEGQAHAEKEAVAVTKETSKANAAAEEAKARKEDSLRKADSLRQVKAHGHAH